MRWGISGVTQPKFQFQPHSEPQPQIQTLLQLLSSVEGYRGGRHQAATSAGSISAVKRTAAITMLAILLSTARVNLVSARHEEAARELLGLLKRTLEAESTTVYEVGRRRQGKGVEEVYMHTNGS